jgi:hypothetical protein
MSWTWNCWIDLVWVAIKEESSSFPRKRESMFDGVTWIPAFAGMTVTRVPFLFPVSCVLCPLSRVPLRLEHRFLPSASCRLLSVVTPFLPSPPPPDSFHTPPTTRPQRQAWLIS